VTKRKSIGPKKRFEVFKRDSFTCQYCGRSAPEVLLEIDHIKPVANGGTNNILNLVTACQGCNRGKGARLLSDNTTISKQKDQLDELNERRLQLEMLADWRESLQDLQGDQVDALAKYFGNYTGYSVNEHGRAEIRRWITRYNMSELYDAIDASVSQYLRVDKDGGKHTQDSVEKAFSYIEKIAAVRKNTKDKPYLRDLFYIRGILRNRLNYVNDVVALRLLEDAYLNGVSIEHLRRISLDVKHWTEFRTIMEETLVSE
jgi:hypothetical protein